MKKILGIIGKTTILAAMFTILLTNVLAQAQTPRDAPVDFNGDGKTDWAVARRNGPISPWTWFIRHNGEENFISIQWGQSPNDLFQPVDYDGDGKDDIALYLNSGGQMHFAYRPSSNVSEGMRSYQWGAAPIGPGTGDLPVAGYNNR